MSGPVWRFERESKGPCDLCLREVTGLLVEGEVQRNTLVTGRRVCRDCYGTAGPMLTRGEQGGRAPAPAYGG